MKSIHLILTVATVLWTLSSPTLHAQEETGQVLEQLVANVDKKLTELEDTLATQAHRQQTVREQLQDYALRYNQETNLMDRAESRSEVISRLSELNRSDRHQVDSTVDAIVSVVFDLAHIEQILSEGEFSPEVLHERRKRIRDVLVKAGPILQSVSEGLDNPAARRQARSTEQILVMLYRQLDTPVHGTQNSLANVRQTVNVLEDVAVQLRLVQELLEVEKISLTIAAHNQIAEMALVRMVNARLGQHNIDDIATALHEDIVSRINNYDDILTESIVSPMPSSRSTANEDILNRIRRGEIPDIE